MDYFIKLKDLYTIPASLFKNPWDIIKLTDTQLALIPKTALIEYFYRVLPLVFDRLPIHIQSDLDVIMCLPCRSHFNTPDSRTYRDESAPARRDCIKCMEQLKKLYRRFQKTG